MTCPHCGAGGPDIWGREVSEVYDGVLFWTCDKCLRAWSRNWTGFGRRQQSADDYVQQWNDHADAVEAALEGWALAEATERATLRACVAVCPDGDAAHPCWPSCGGAE